MTPGLARPASYQNQRGPKVDGRRTELGPGQCHFLPGQLAAAPDPSSIIKSDNDQRVTIWNRVEQRKLSGNSAPFRRNLKEYLALHPDWEIYNGQYKGPLKKRKAREEDEEPLHETEEKVDERISTDSKRLILAVEAGGPNTPKFNSTPFLEQRITIWNSEEMRKLSGNSAPLRKNLVAYLNKHPGWEVYIHQDAEGLKREKLERKHRCKVGVNDEQARVPIWNHKEQRKLTGSAAPLRKNLEAYLAIHQDWEVWSGQGVKTMHVTKKYPTPCRLKIRKTEASAQEREDAGFTSVTPQTIEMKEETSYDSSADSEQEGDEAADDEHEDSDPRDQQDQEASAALTSLCSAARERARHGAWPGL